MARATVTTKGQVTIPKRIRDRLRLKAGDRIEFRERDDGTVVVETETVDVRSLRGSVRPRASGVSLEDMAAAIRTGATRRTR